MPPVFKGVGYSMTNGKTSTVDTNPVSQVLRNPSIARVYDYLLGGKDNFEVDRRLGDELLEIYPQAGQLAEDNREFVRRAVRYVAGQGIAQFIDIGCGLPASPVVHEVAQSVIQGARVVYVDHNPVVLAHARACLAECSNGVDGNMHKPAQVLTEPELNKFIDLSQSVALLLTGVLHFATCEAARAIVQGFMAPLAAGSYVVISVGTTSDPQLARRFTTAYTAEDFHAHPPETIASWFNGLELVEPGLVEAASWRPGPRQGESPPLVATVLAEVGCKRVEPT